MPRTSSLAIITYPRTESSSQAASPTSPQSAPLVSGTGSFNGSNIEEDTETKTLPAQPQPPSSPRQPKSFFPIHRTGKSFIAQGSAHDQRQISQSMSTNNLNTGPTCLKPYSQSPESSTTSLVVQGNNEELETASVTTGMP